MKGKLKPRSTKGPAPVPKRGRLRKTRARPGSKSVLILPDIHCGPDFDELAVDCAVRIAKHYKPDEVVVLGDMLDCHLFSAHPAKSINDAKIADFFHSEVQPANAILDELQKHCNKLVFIEGNHENRILRMAATNKVLAQFYEVIRPEALLGFTGKRDGVEFVSYDGPLPHYKITPKCIAIHGWSVSQNFARAHHMMLGGSTSVVCGHVHRAQTYKTRNPITGEVLVSWSPGCLSLLQPSYVYHSPTQWTQGVSIMFASETSGNFQKYDIQIDRGVAYLPDNTKIVGKESNP